MQQWNVNRIVIAKFFNFSPEKVGSSQHMEDYLKAEFRVRRSQDSAFLSSEHWVEVAMVADHTMLEYHGLRELEAYLFTLMNMVSRCNFKLVNLVTAALNWCMWQIATNDVPLCINNNV